MIDSLAQLDKSYVKIGFLILYILGFLIVQRRNNLKLTLQYLLYSYGIGILLLSIAIPHVFSGYPQDITDLDNKKRLLHHLQENNEALVQTTEAFRDMALFTFLILSTVINKVIKHVKLDQSAE